MWWKKNKNIAIRTSLHLVFWGVMTFFFVLVFAHQYKDYAGTAYFVICLMAITAATTYFTLYFLIPRFLLKRKYFHFALYSFYSLQAMILLEFSVILFFLIGLKTSNITLDPTTLNLFLLIAATYFVVFLASAIKLLKHWLMETKSKEQIAREKVEAELSMLKSQINPHFLFNTLNSIYSLSMKKSEHTPEVVVKLSEMLNYLLYECNEEKVALEKEIALINNYLSLEKTRHGKRLHIESNLDVANKIVTIAPNMLLPFVENSFKHGVGKKRGNVWVKIDISEKNGIFKFVVENIKPENSSKSEHGIGLENIKRRLELVYKNKYSLNIKNKGNTFLIELELNL